ncbi:pyridoxal phosphate-dependent aminotransferase [Sulfitobacter sp. M57]|uniref:MalY/PatB family protein n=1 Tax=unclassified Sulfitobacter TaxID=196795 RepID=UPI0023E0D160|nr:MULTISPECIES: MalY/PatB family protein [unclassified Sulfitobacter]MDF3416207.1 pyridoxal phosphate-dependent aminotransferase [Sulfitobacter sp. KE5]MDF3423686.1 pyridoxal phosphate-dependent aminotransferase [Sulfitobacter sp. KE43]MDF3434753.1 pyridoxal phosphate-dependent aminotransferase [Sulfitobacter sp. KE42]MDF3460392.1 pyridoxal phosphate-dependent aminotransferase [Sulfitobacter sp. S74]MDF3464290.1 pyridoxal phosphate-dependent aminotransferase [Sulfitobacter sp. Ks18]
MSFDEIIDRRDTHCAKWDKMEALYGVPRDEGIAMWVADMDFRPPEVVQQAVRNMVDHGVYGYFGDDSKYLGAIQWWMKTRHNWEIDPSWIFTTHGLVNGTAMCVDAYTSAGDGVVLFTPVYHAFARVIEAAGRKVVECEMAVNAGRYEMDFDAWDAQMTGGEKMLILCSPHNPGGRVWSRAELQGVADFAKRHDLILVSDEIHHDLVMPGNTHIPMSRIDGVTDRLVMMTATTKTFNIAGSHSGNVIIEDPDLRAKFAARMMAMGLSANSFGLFMATAAYSPEGAAWVDDLVAYLEGNRRLFDDAVNAIPGLKSMNLEATYLAWVDFADTGMARDEFTRRVQEDAKIAVNHGPTFGKGGDSFLRFNIATPRARVQEACERLAEAFRDLQ